MERKSFKEHGLDCARSMRGKESAAKNGSGYGYAVTDHDYLAGISWPPRSYTCSFCKREFRSAQALGGHMNVHRRDRARLRHSPSKDNIGKYSFLNLNPKPKPPPIFPFGTSLSPHPFSSSTPLSPPCPAASAGVWGLERAINYPPSFPKVSKRGESILPFDLKIGLFCGRSEEDLDLELRLGYS